MIQPAPAAVAATPDQRVHIIQGDFQVSGLAHVVFTTTLGSCVATCMRDPLAQIGGMNHFLLPHGEDIEGPGAQRYGAYAMELLINALLRVGAKRNRLEAKLFGGGRLSERLPDIGGQNATFAENFLAHEGIACHGGSVRGRHARRLQFWPACGRVRQLALPASHDVFESERAAPLSHTERGAVELF